MEWTVEKVRLHLGLKPWRILMVERDQHYESIRGYFSEEEWRGVLGRGRCYPRRTGRTMYLKLAAVAAAGNGKTVVIYAHSWSYTKRIANEARWMAKQCGIDPTLIQLPQKLHPTAEDDVGIDYSKPRPAQGFYDHHYWEHELERQRALWGLSRNKW